jgi:hypothetical protein
MYKPPRNVNIRFFEGSVGWSHRRSFSKQYWALGTSEYDVVMEDAPQLYLTNDVEMKIVKECTPPDLELMEELSASHSIH